MLEQRILEPIIDAHHLLHLPLRVHGKMSICSRYIRLEDNQSVGMAIFMMNMKENGTEIMQVIQLNLDVLLVNERI